MFEGLPAELVVGWWTLCGLFVGSFLNVAIHRLPLEGETVSRPRRSRCPACRRQLTWKENVPLVSWLAQRGRCRGCGWRIPWRYPLVEALNAALWFLVGRSTLPDAPLLCLVLSVVLSGLVVATFVDFDCFEIPDEVSIGGIVLAPLASLALPGLHAHGAVALALSSGAATPTRAAALTASLAGIVVGGGLLWAVGRLGSRVYGRDAMGFGDVKLLAAGGGFVGPVGALVALMIASLVASLVGLLNMLRFFALSRARARARGRRGGVGRSLRVARIAGRYLPFGPYLALGIAIVLLYWPELVAFLRA